MKQGRDKPGPASGTGRGDSSLTPEIITGITNGVANVPDAMANALLAGVSPIAGLYALLAGTPVAALTSSSQFMTVAVTAAMAVTVESGISALPAAQRGAAVTVMALLVGAFMILFGLLRGGRMLRFVSNAVMKGFLNGVAVLVIVGQLTNATGFASERSTKFGRAIDTALNLGSWDLTTLVVTLSTIALIVVLGRTPWKNYAMLVPLVAMSAIVYAMDVSVMLVSSVSRIPSGLPMPAIPDFGLLPGMVVPALSVALIALVQGGGISKSYQNLDGTYPNASRDMVGQGFGNVAASAFGGMPVGASVSSTALVAGSGARTRLPNIMVGIVIAVVLLLLGPLVEIVPLSVLGGMLIVVGVRAIDLPGMLDVWYASKESAAIMAITLGSMLLMPVQYAVLLGAALSAVQYVYSSSKDVRVVALERTPEGRWAEHEPPATLPSNAVTVVDIYGSVFYAGVELVDKLLPSVGDAVKPCLIVRMRGRSEIGSTALLMFRRYHERISAAGGRLILAGVDAALLEKLRRTGLVDELGPENVLNRTDIVFESTEAAYDLGQSWLRVGQDVDSPGA